MVETVYDYRPVIERVTLVQCNHCLQDVEHFLPMIAGHTIDPTEKATIQVAFCHACAETALGLEVDEDELATFERIDEGDLQHLVLPRNQRTEIERNHISSSALLGSIAGSLVALLFLIIPHNVDVGFTDWIGFSIALLLLLWVVESIMVHTHD